MTSETRAVIRVLLRHREEIARSTERAYRELRRLGVPDPALLLVGPSKPVRDAPGGEA